MLEMKNAVLIGYFFRRPMNLFLCYFVLLAIFDTREPKRYANRTLPCFDIYVVGIVILKQFNRPAIQMVIFGIAIVEQMVKQR